MSEPEGIIYPSPDLRDIVDRTATYVAKNGSAFEARIMNEHRGKPRFSFLLPNDPFNAYYKYKVVEIRNSLLSSNQSSKTPNTTADTNNSRPEGSKEQVTDRSTNDNNGIRDTQLDKNNGETIGTEKQNNNCDTEGASQNGQEDSINESSRNLIKPQLDEYIQEKTMKLEEQSPLNFLAYPTSIISHVESDVIKLTSQFVATYGRSFLLELVSREQTNSLFDFLKPQHGLFPYMTNLVMQYALIQNPPLDILEHLEKDSSNQRHVLDRIRKRTEWNRMLEVEKKKREEAEEREKELYNQIDWHDFVIVETVDYQPGDKGEYPPTTADQVGTRLLKQQRLEDHNIPEEMEIDMDVESDNESAGEKHEYSDDFAAPLPPDLNKVIIRKDYDPKAASKAASLPDNYFVSPITNERIPVDKIHEHVRYNLADPKYLEKKEQILQSKMIEDSVFASGSQIQDSLKSLAERRTDIFGITDAETVIGQRIGEDSEQQKKEDKIIWDGHKSSLKRKKLN